MGRWRIGLSAILFVLAAFLFFFILYALLTYQGPTSHPHRPHNHDKPIPNNNGGGEGGCGCGNDNENVSTGTGGSTGTSTGTGTGTGLAVVVGPPPLSMPFLDYLKQPGLKPLGITPESHPVEWAKIWTSGTLSQISCTAPRIEFYFNDYCPACKRFKPMWDEAVNWFPARLQRAVVSCGEPGNALPCAAVQKIPTVIFRRNAHDAGMVFTATKTKESLLEFVNSNYELYQESLSL